jgi:hypothetical protein
MESKTRPQHYESAILTPHLHGFSETTHTADIIEGKRLNPVYNKLRYIFKKWARYDILYFPLNQFSWIFLT